MDILNHNYKEQKTFFMKGFLNQFLKNSSLLIIKFYNYLFK